MGCASVKPRALPLNDIEVSKPLPVSHNLPFESRNGSETIGDLDELSKETFASREPESEWETIADLDVLLKEADDESSTCSTCSTEQVGNKSITLQWPSQALPAWQLKEKMHDHSIHVMVHWKVIHSLDFISGVIDFASGTKLQDQVKYYGFARKSDLQSMFLQGVCWEGYDRAADFLAHIEGGAQKPMQDMCDVRRRVSTSAKCPAGEIESIEAIGPRDELEVLRKGLQHQRQKVSYYSTTDYASCYSPAAYDGLNEFENDQSLTAIVYWQVTNKVFFSECVPALVSNFKEELQIKRFSVARDVKAGETVGATVVTFISYISPSGFKMHWQNMWQLRQRAQCFAKISQLLLHGPSTSVKTIKYSGVLDQFGDVLNLWYALNGSFYCPASFIPSVDRPVSRICDATTDVRASAIPGRQSRDCPPERCIVSVAKLLQLAKEARIYFGARYAAVTMYDVNAHLIQPACEAEGKPYALIGNGPPPAGTKFVFVTHAWKENFNMFIKDVIATVKSLEKESSSENLHIWICAFALCQSSNKSKVRLEVGNDPLTAPFTRAMRDASFYLIIRNGNLDIYDRIWCCWELYCAFSLGLLRSNKLRIAGRSKMRHSASVVSDIRGAASSDPNDKAAILKYIDGTEGMCDHINFIVNLVRQV